MKKILISTALCGLSFLATAQNTPANTNNFELGNGLNFSMNQGEYTFKLGGMIQPYIGSQRQGNEDVDYYFFPKRTYLNFSGNALKEKVSFFFQLDFSLANPLLDAYISYNPIGSFVISAGQKQNFGNNREMLVMEDQLQYPNRSLLSTEFSRTGREFGLFLENTFGNDNFAVIPQISVTSGDGRNSFGTDSRDVDNGGLKYVGRVDIYPLGKFSPGNEKMIADLVHEHKPRMVLGGAASYNKGASEAVGEGHSKFLLYNENGAMQLPDYRQLYADVLLKYQGFSFLGEYVIATATSLQGAFTDPGASVQLMPTEISRFLSLGTAYNAQAGYVTRSGYAVDLRYSTTSPEFSTNVNSIIQETTAYTLGLSKYFKGNALKIQAAFSSIQQQNQPNNIFLGELLFQLMF